MALSLLPYFIAKLIVGMLSGRMLERWCPDDDVLAERYLVEKLDVDPATLEGLDKEGILHVFADKMSYAYEEGAVLAQDYGLWEILHDTYPRDSQTLWLIIAGMAIWCPIGIVLLRNVIRGRENVDGDETLPKDEKTAEDEDDDSLRDE